MPLKVNVPGGGPFFNEETSEIFYVKPVTITLEHSLVSLSKWESKWKKPFLGKTELTDEQTMDYIRCMTITQNVDPMVYRCLTPENVKSIVEYIKDPMTATTFGPDNGRPNREVVTSELIYYWMIACDIPVEFQKWHLNRLLTLIRVCTVKNAPPKKMSASQAISRNAKLNAARRKAWHSKG